MTTPDSRGRIAGTTYPADRAPEGSQALGRRWRSLREVAARLFIWATLEVLRPEPGDILVVRGGCFSSAQRRRINRLIRRRTGGVAVFLPGDCRVHLEPPRLSSEDRGTPAGGAVFTGVPGGAP